MTKKTGKDTPSPGGGERHRIIAAVCVRMGSSRLPGKTLMPVLGRPLLGHLVDRLRGSAKLDGIVIATSIKPADDAIEAFCHDEGIAYFRGDEDDVLGRLLGALKANGAGVGVVAFGDCPLIDPVIVDEVIDFFLDHGNEYDFVGNDLQTTYPPGMEVEVFPVAALEAADRNEPDPSVREHATLHIRKNKGLFRVHNVEAPPHNHAPDLELEVDVAVDLDVIENVIRHFHLDWPRTPLADIIELSRNRPELFAVNRGIFRRWKTFREDGEK